MTYSILTAACKPAEAAIPITSGSTLDWREYWRRQSIADHTDWQSLGVACARALWRAGLASSLCWCSS
jgi:hypothetical protein